MTVTMNYMISRVYNYITVSWALSSYKFSLVVTIVCTRAILVSNFSLVVTLHRAVNEPGNGNLLSLPLDLITWLLPSLTTVDNPQAFNRMVSHHVMRKA